MATALSNDIRKRLILAVESGMSRRSAAERFGVAPSTAIKWVDRWRQSGSFEPLARGGDKRSQRIERHAEDILQQVAEAPDMTLRELAAYLEETHSEKVSQSMVWRLLDRHGLTFKKNRTRQRATTA